MENTGKADFKGKDIDKIIQQIEEIFEEKYHKYLSVFDLDPSKLDSDLDEAILKSFKKAKDVEILADLCLSWNRPDIAKKFIFDDYRENVIHFVFI